MLLLRVGPVTAGVAGTADMLSLAFLLHGLIYPGNITSKLWIRAHCRVKGHGVSQYPKQTLLALVSVGPGVVSWSLRGLVSEHLRHDAVHVCADQPETVEVRAEVGQTRSGPLRQGPDR